MITNVMLLCIIALISVGVVLMAQLVKQLRIIGHVLYEASHGEQEKST